MLDIITSKIIVLAFHPTCLVQINWLICLLCLAQFSAEVCLTNRYFFSVLAKNVWYLHDATKIRSKLCVFIPPLTCCNYISLRNGQENTSWNSYNHKLLFSFVHLNKLLNPPPPPSWASDLLNCISKIIFFILALSGLFVTDNKFDYCFFLRSTPLVTIETWGSMWNLFPILLI